MTTYDEVLFKIEPGHHGNLGHIILNRPAALNSLNHQMVLAMLRQLTAWAQDDSIKAVIISATEGRAFCAGGDLRFTYERFKQDRSHVDDFFRDEYALNRCIFHFPKPYIALLNGITMGGGVGISIHGSHRVATERFLFAMPETGIGFYPDVGGTYFLPRLSGVSGRYLGLTGARLGAADCLRLGLVQHVVKPEELTAIVNLIAEKDFGADAKQAVNAVLQPFQVEATNSTLAEYQPIINICFSGDSVEDIISVLHASNDTFCKEALAQLEKKSPTSLKVTFKALELGKTLDFDACMQQEFRLTHHFLNEHDFLEGIRALIIDKDQNPDWQPKTLKEIPEKSVMAYFAPIEKELAIESVR